MRRSPTLNQCVALLLIGIAGYYLFAFVYWRLLTRYPDDKGEPIRSSSMEQARERGFLVSAVRLEPTSLTWNGARIEFDEAWIEEAARTRFDALLRPYERGEGWYFLCLTLKKGRGYGSAVFRLEGQEGRGLGQMGWVFYSDHIPYPEIFDLHLRGQTTWEDIASFDIAIKRP